MDFELDPTNTFASAEDFAHLLDQDDENDDAKGDGRPAKKTKVVKKGKSGQAPAKGKRPGKPKRK
jgi:hypothetical protein